MMNKKILTAAALALMTVACTQKVEQPLKYGQLSVSLSGEPSVEVVTKATALDQTSEDAKDYTVRIYDKTDAPGLKYEASYYEFATQTLPLGTYYVTAENCTEAEAETGNGQMRLAGKSADVTLSADALTGTATVECAVTNAKVSVQFDASVAGRFSDLKVTLSGGTTRAEAITVAETVSDVVTETWFNPSALTYTISGTFTGSGMNKEVNLSKSIELAAKNNIMLLVKVNLENGQLTPSVTIDTTIDEPTVENGEFNPYL